MFVPVLVLLLMGMTELARITYLYYSLHKTLYTVARYIGTQQGANFCDAQDAIVQAGKNYAVTGSADAGGTSLIANLTPDMIQVRVERVSPDTQEIGDCECSLTGCDIGAGGRPADYIVVSIPDGYSIRPLIPYLSTEPIVFKPRVMVPVGG